MELHHITCSIPVHVIPYGRYSTISILIMEMSILYIVSVHDLHMVSPQTSGLFSTAVTPGPPTN